MNISAPKVIRTRSVILILLSISWIVSTAVFGQNQTGGIKGSVRNLHGDPIPGAEITLLRPNGDNEGMKVLTAPDGTFRIFGIPHGRYELAVTRGGFKQSITRQFDLSTETAVFDLRLTP